MHNHRLLLVFIMLSAIVAFAAVPKLISFQGRLVDGSGVPISDGTHYLTFRIYDVPTGGTEMWAETLAVNTSNGIFSVMLGTVNPLTDVDFSDSLFLGVQLGTVEEYSPRYRLGASPYAFWSIHSDTAIFSDTANYSIESEHSALADTSDYSLESEHSHLADSANVSSMAHTVSWSDISDMPSGFADGSDDGTNYLAGSGIDITGTVISIADGGVDTWKIADEAITADKLDNMGALTGQVIKWNGSSWVPANDETRTGETGVTNIIVSEGIAGGGTGEVSLGIAVAGVTTDKLADNSVTTYKLNPLGGSDGQVLKVSGGAVVWGDDNVGGNHDATLTGDGTTSNPLGIADGGVTNDKIAENSISTSKIQNGAITSAKISSEGGSTGQILKITSGGSVVWADDETGSGSDDWGSQVVEHDSTLSGNGLATNTLGIAVGAVNTIYLADGAVTTDKLSDAAVTPPKISTTGGSEGQVLKIVGGTISWADDEAGGLTGIYVSNSAGVTQFTADETNPQIRVSGAGGIDISFDSYTNNIVIDGSGITGGVTPGDITSVTVGTGLLGGATSGDATINLDLAWFDARYVSISSPIDANTLDGYSASDFALAGHTHTISGDVDGTIDGSVTVVGLRNNPIANTSPSSGDFLGWSGSQWTPTQVNWDDIADVPSGFSDGIDDVDDADNVVGNEDITAMNWVDSSNTLIITDHAGDHIAEITGFIESEIDGDTTNELITDVSYDSETYNLTITDAGSSWVADLSDLALDSDSTNELITDVNYDTTAHILTITEAGSVWTADFSADFATSGISDVNWDDSSNLLTITDMAGDHTVEITGFLESEIDGDTTNELITDVSYDLGTHNLTIADAGSSWVADLSDLALDSDSTNELITDATFNAGSNTLTISDAGNDWNIDLSSLADDSDWVKTGNNLYSAPSGSVGIGTEAPTAKLDVDGDIHTSGDLKIDRYTNSPLPIAYGYVDSNLTSIHATSNVSSITWNSSGSYYEIRIAGETYTEGNYIAVVTISAELGVAYTSSDAGMLDVYIEKYTGGFGGGFSLSKANFQFAVYKP